MPKIMALLALGMIFYLGVILNLSLLELNQELSNIVKFASMAILAVIILLETFRAIFQARHPAQFFQDRIVQNKREMFYTAITGIFQRRNALDKLFRTYSLYLGNRFFLRSIPEGVQLEGYVRQLIEYSNSESR